jgi:Mg2+-importing ATPase
MSCTLRNPPQGNSAIQARPVGIEQRSLTENNVADVALANLFATLRSGEAGLSGPAASAILNSVGRNEIETAGRKHFLANFLARFRNPLVLVLLGAAGVSAATGDIASFVIITTIILISVVLDVVQERRAEDAAARLRAQVSLSTKVLRNGRPVDVPAAEIVPGDVVILSAGDLVPADCRLMEARDLYVNEALLTGEPYPAEKNAAPPAAAATEGAFPPNLVFMGTSVVSGTAKALVYATGRKAQLGSIAHSLRKEPPPAAFAVGIRDFGLMIVRLTSLLVLFVLFANLLFHRPLLESFLFALALAVGLTPELLPMVVSVTLAHGAIRLSRKQVIVKRLSAIHDLGSMDVLCSDKTGTLTEARIELVRAIDIAGNESRSAFSKAQLNAACETGLKSPLDEAILAAGPCDLASWRKIDEVPFDFERRRVSILLEHEGKRLLIVKGAPEDIMRLASRFEAGDNTKPFDDDARRTAEATFNALGADGYRALGVAWREVGADREHVSLEDENDLTFCGFVVFLDPPKQGAREA